MPILTINVLFQNNDYVKRLEQERLEAEKRADDLKKRYISLDSKYADIAHVNIELIDVLRANGIRYRKYADISKWEKS